MPLASITQVWKIQLCGPITLARTNYQTLIRQHGVIACLHMLPPRVYCVHATLSPEVHLFTVKLCNIGSALVQNCVPNSQLTKYGDNDHTNIST